MLAAIGRRVAMLRASVERHARERERQQAGCDPEPDRGEGERGTEELRHDSGGIVRDAPDAAQPQGPKRGPPERTSVRSAGRIRAHMADGTGPGPGAVRAFGRCRPCLSSKRPRATRACDAGADPLDADDSAGVRSKRFAEDRPPAWTENYAGRGSPRVASPGLGFLATITAYSAIPRRRRTYAAIPARLLARSVVETTPSARPARASG